jgi:hypothetical protein
VLQAGLPELYDAEINEPLPLTPGDEGRIRDSSASWRIEQLLPTCHSENTVGHALQPFDVGDASKGRGDPLARRSEALATQAQEELSRFLESALSESLNSAFPQDVLIRGRFFHPMHSLEQIDVLLRARPAARSRHQLRLIRP